MSWQYELRDEQLGEARWPACPNCGNMGTVVWLRDDTYACLHEYPYRSFGARWVEDAGEPREEAAS